MLVDTSCFFKCETCTHNRANGCDTFCDTGESYSPCIQKLMPINDGDFLVREEVIQEVLSQMAISSNPEAMRERILNLQGVSIQKHGEWIGEADGYADGELVYDVWYCSECNHCIDDGTDSPDFLPNYCSNCGAKMDGGKEK